MHIRYTQHTDGDRCQGKMLYVVVFWGVGKLKLRGVLFIMHWIILYKFLTVLLSFNLKYFLLTFIILFPIIFIHWTYLHKLTPSEKNSSKCTNCTSTHKTVRHSRIYTPISNDDSLPWLLSPSLFYTLQYCTVHKIEGFHFMVGWSDWSVSFYWRI